MTGGRARGARAGRRRDPSAGWAVPPPGRAFAMSPGGVICICASVVLCLLSTLLVLFTPLDPRSAESVSTAARTSAIATSAQGAAGMALISGAVFFAGGRIAAAQAGAAQRIKVS